MGWRMKAEDWNFHTWQRFNHRLYQTALTTEDITENGNQEFHETLFHITKGILTELQIPQEKHRTIIKLTKANKKYLLPAIYEQDLPIKPTQTTRCQLSKNDKKIWEFITQPTIMNIQPQLRKNSTLKKFLSDWNPQRHTNTTHWTLLKAISLASKYKSIKLCVCSEPSNGKNSNFTIINHITRDVCRIQKPTVAKLETVLYYNKVVLPDEITSMNKTDVGAIESIILSIADNSTEYNKHSMATNKKLNTVDLTQLSIIFTYNRVSDMSAGSKFFDEKWNSISAFKSRYPQLLLNGKIAQTLPNLNQTQAQKLMEDNFEEMKAIAKEFMYWTSTLQEHLHGWDRKRIELSPRHTTNLEGLLEVLDVLSDTQEEMDYWLDTLSDCIEGYKRMLVGQGNETLVVREEKMNP